MSLATVLDALEADPAGGFSIAVPPSWSQGRTLYGGLNVTLAARAARLSDDDLGPLRSVQIAFLAPASGRLRYVPCVLRRGRSVTFLGVDCSAGAELCARVMLTYGRPREADLTHSRLSAPEVPAPESCPPVEIAADVAPTFLSEMELRFGAGSPPMSGQEPDFAIWTRHRDGSGVDAESALLAIADVLPPAVLASRSEFRPASSITWGIDLAAVPADPSDWYLLHSSSDAAAGGYSLQAMSCFGRDGRLAAVGRQSVAVF